MAIDVPAPWGPVLTARRGEAGDPQAAYVPAHVTLLGPTEIEDDRLPEIERHLEKVAAGQQPFVIRLRGTGTFRPVTDVVFVALSMGISECELLAEAILSADGIERDSRFPYHPHVTVAKDVPAPALDAVFDDLSGFSAHFDVSGFTLSTQVVEGPWLRRRDFPLGL